MMKIFHGYGAKGHTRRKSFTPKDMGCDRLHYISSLSSVFHTQEGMSIIVRVVNYVFWHLKREFFYVQTNTFHAFTDFFQLNDPEIEKHFK